MMRFLKKILNLGFAWMLFRSLFGYLDPGTGSLLVQLLLAAFLGITATFRFWKDRVRSLFGLRKPAQSPDEESSVNTD